MSQQNLETQIELELSHWWFRARRQILGEIVRALTPPSKGTRIVDVGCGVGVDAWSLASDYEVTGIDQWAEALDLAAQRLPGPRFVFGNILNDFDDLVASAQVLLITDILEHIEHDQALFRRVLELARPRAFLLLTVPTALAIWSPRDPREDDFLRYTPATLLKLWNHCPVEELLFAWMDWSLRSLQKVPLCPTLAGLSAPRGELPSTPPRLINRLLERIFAGESRQLLEELRGVKRCGYRPGSSLVVVLQKLG